MFCLVCLCFFLTKMEIFGIIGRGFYYVYMTNETKTKGSKFIA